MKFCIGTEFLLQNLGAALEVEEGVMVASTVNVLLARVRPGTWTEETLEIRGQNMEMLGTAGSNFNAYSALESVVWQSCRTCTFYYAELCDRS